MWESQQAAWRPIQGFVRRIQALLDFGDHQCSELLEGLGECWGKRVLKGPQRLENEDDSPPLEAPGWVKSLNTKCPFSLLVLSLDLLHILAFEMFLISSLLFAPSSHMDSKRNLRRGKSSKSRRL